MTDFKKKFDALSQEYLQALAQEDLAAILALFSADAMIISPLYGTLPATDFYALLLNDTQASDVKLKDTLVNEQKRSGALFFQYNWTLENGQKVTFEVVDYLQLNKENLIERLQIIYDTYQTRPLWNEQKRFNI
jgi:steroid delta-isomerase